ncbi:hypothetical protein SLEP1_g49743 [Rubroshorea leprosula]|uniref:Uncharacterized protein n=1 Tax=Rubroshorea leprosula TaxID=152421 RepID=A0AAV5LYR4_9ROSI|nr:hypothetical protein SLEP1_g49743 [Rubroshorea leprosula]
MSDNNNVLNVSAFNSALDTLLYYLTNKAASVSSLRKFATGTARTSSSAAIACLNLLPKFQHVVTVSREAEELEKAVIQGLRPILSITLLLMDRHRYSRHQQRYCLHPQTVLQLYHDKIRIHLGISSL